MWHQQTPLIEIYLNTHPHRDQMNMCRVRIILSKYRLTCNKNHLFMNREQNFDSRCKNFTWPVDSHNWDLSTCSYPYGSEVGLHVQKWVKFCAKLPIKITYFLTAEPIFTPVAQILHQQTPLIEIYPYTHPHLDQKDLCKSGYGIILSNYLLTCKITDKNHLFYLTTVNPI